MTEEEGISWVPRARRHYHSQLHLIAWVWASLLLLGLAAWAGLGYQLSDVLRTEQKSLLTSNAFAPHSSRRGLESARPAPGHASYDKLKPRQVWNGSEEDLHSPKIYVYPLPPSFQQCDITFYEYFLYGAEKTVPVTIMESEHMTADPEEADFFYVPPWTYCLSHRNDIPELGGQRANHWLTSTTVLNIIRREYPYWDRRGGVDHIWLFSHDHGFCGFWTNDGAVPELANSIILSHWGLMKPEIACSWWTRLHNFGTCLERQLPEAYDQRFNMPCFVPGKDIVVAHPLEDQTIFLLASHYGWQNASLRTVVSKPAVASDAIADMGISQPAYPQERTLSFSFQLLVPVELRLSDLKTRAEQERMAELLNQLQDALAAFDVNEEERASNSSQIIERWMKEAGTTSVSEFLSAHTTPMISQEKEHTLYFLGGLRPEDPSYSHGVRQTVHALFSNTEGFKIMETPMDHLSHNEVLKGAGRSTFCLVVTGAGFGVRMKQAVMFGCIPVVIADGVQMEHEEVLPYGDFALRVPQHAIYLLPTILDLVTREPGRVEAMQQRVACVWRYLSWHRVHGRALEPLMCSLRRRLYGTDIWPVMDWGECRLTCGGSAEVDQTALEPNDWTDLLKRVKQQSS